MLQKAALPAILLFLFSAGLACSPSSGPEGTVRLDFDRKDPKPFVEFYFGLFSPNSRGVFESGLVVESDGEFYLNPSLMAPELWAEIEGAGADGTLEWDELKPFFAAHYYDRIDAPPSLAMLLEEDTLSTDGWLEMEVIGVMSTAIRHVLMPRSAVRSALDDYAANGNRILYPIGTTIVADHTLDQTPVETTAMRKRADGRWDFFAFDGQTNLADSTQTPPKSLAVPTQCTGCHLGSRLFEPEKSFPGAAPDGPDGPREIRIGDRFRNAEAVKILDEHRKRSDGILGLYATMYVSELMAAREDGTITDRDAQLLTKLGL